MKKNYSMRIASMLLVLVLLTTCVISGTFAKYVTSGSATEQARVAKWGVEFSASTTEAFSTNLKDEELHIVRPDVVVYLPNDRHLIIDSKVTLTSYLEYIEDNSKINEFKSEVKKRITDLANKNYQNAGDLSQPDFVLMYMPIESSINLIFV